MKIDRVKVTRNDGVKGSAGHFKSDYDSYLQFTNLNTETNVTYTLHGFIKSTAAHTVSCLGQSGNTVANQWWEFIFQIVPPKTGFSFFFPPGEYWFYNWKLEKGLITTLWTPNGDDITDMKDTIITMGSSIEQLDKSITQKVWMTEVNSAKQEVETHISTVEQTANKIHWLVKSGDSESNMTLTDNALNIITSYVNVHGKVTFSQIDTDAVNKLTALHPVRNWDHAYTTINETVPAVVSDFNRTPRVNEVFTNPDSSANIGTWKITSVSGNKVGMQLLSFTPAKALQCKDNFNGSYTDTTKQYGLNIGRWFNREPLVNEIFKNYDTDSHLGVWKVVSKDTTTVQVQLQSYTSIKGNPGKNGAVGKPGTNGRSALQAKRHWTSVYTTVGGTATANASDFNRTPIVGDTFMNLDGSSNIGTWQITAISGTTVTMKLLSVVNVKGDKGDTGKPGTNGKNGADGKPGSKGLNSLQAKRNWTGTFTEAQATITCATSDFNRTPVVGDVFTNLDGSCNIGIWQVTAVSGTAVTIKLLFCNTTVSNINSTLKNVKSALNAIAPINNDPTKTVINGGKIATGTITANSIAANAITSAKIIANAVTTSKIATNAIIADKIAANAVTADKISVKTLSAINANLGTITAGSLSAVSINNGKGTFIVNADGGVVASNLQITGGAIKITSVNEKNEDIVFRVTSKGNVTATNLYLERIFATKNVVFNSDDPKGGLYSNQNLFAEHEISCNGGLYSGGDYYCKKNIYAVGKISTATWSSSSDRRLKQDIFDLTDKDTFSLLNNFKPKTYKFKSQTDVLRIGFIAQEVEETLKNQNLDKTLFVQTIINPKTKETTLGLNYIDMIAVLWKGWQLHQSTLQSQNNRINFLEKQIPQLQNQILQLQNQLSNINGGKIIC